MGPQKNTGESQFDMETPMAWLDLANFKLVDFSVGDELRRKGIHYSNMYLIVSGQVEVLPEGRSEPIILGPGSPVGEIGFIRGCRATGTATVLQPTQALFLNDATLWDIERKNPPLALHLLRKLAQTAQFRLDRDANLAVEVEAETEGKARPEVILCRNDDMLEQAMGIRYQIYCEELGRSSPYADHERKLIRDNLDSFGYTFIAMLEDQVVGTLRANFAADGDLGTLEALYGMAESPHHPKHTLICTKLAVEKSRRGSVIYMELIRAVTAYVMNTGRDIRECYIDCIPGLLALYKRIGFVPAGEMFYHYENGPSLPMVMDLEQYSKTLAKRL
ncbi:N-acyl amino acid synthase FeeM domain-containing protein [Candidatus Thiodiazotropha endoloripes]|uniref:Cyclic nucleotide-binding domain-containing protein n=1 Tax=Candidatus Thiodiazotropha endoloripes TaxID=1818881 RepID=A0A1E2UPU4_9GAMM|nr:cyclic nucleotide-binding domain-containing protein [Candidatus Thiodiazotropha endoloripes]ODB96786.1 hypothetical protein A3196_08480 [Candidatus Thiodiazotropha endoloripes]